MRKKDEGSRKGRRRMSIALHLRQHWCRCWVALTQMQSVDIYTSICDFCFLSSCIYVGTNINAKRWKGKEGWGIEKRGEKDEHRFISVLVSTYVLSNATTDAKHWHLHRHLQLLLCIALHLRQRQCRCRAMKEGRRIRDRGKGE